MAAEMVDYDDPANLEKWLAQEHAHAEGYLKNEGLAHNGVSSEPAWFVPPFLALWEVKSLKDQAQRGWWVVTGAIPADYISAGDAADPRDALRVIGRNWREYAEQMLQGKAHHDVTIGNAENLKEIGGLLLKRAQILEGIVAAEEHW